ncbi:hypothetical protein HPULCUR_010319 [Helicostylum pulchrum]|uniref:F-box domain-containing protein n=1 Tax=Helicostylum pulchrum TaxID=562976 RepID=A0ABP9YCY2_9FUNG
MSSLNQFPFEVLYKIASHLETNDQRTCLTVCKAWYRPLLETLYNLVQIKDLRSFRSFLVNITHHRHQPNFYVKKLEMPYMTSDWELSERAMMFTEFELLARHCIYLTEISFIENGYWRWMARLDFTKYWLRLTKLPLSFGSKDSFIVFQGMADRITSLELRADFPSPLSVLDLIPQILNLQTLYIHDRVMTLNMLQLQKLDHIENLTLLTNVISSEDYSLRSPTKLKTFACAIDDPNSSWFSIFKSYYQDIDTLTVHCQTDNNNTEDCLLKILESVLDTTHATKIQQVKTSFYDTHDFRLTVESVIMDIIYDYTIRDRRGIPSVISFDIKYYDASVFVYPRNSFESIFSRNDTQQHVFKVTKSWLDDEKKNDEIKFLDNIINDPIHLQLTHLSITRVTHCLGPTPPFYLDILLHQYPRLESFSFSVSKKININRKRLGRPEYIEGAEIMINDPTTCFHPIRILKIKSSKINRSVFHFLFKSCTRLKKLYLHDCYFKDDETIIAIEYFCLRHGVELIIIK